MSLEIVYRQENEQKFLDYWQFIVERKSVDFRYYPENIAMYKLLGEERKTLHHDFSFIYVLDKKPLAGVLFFVEREGKKKSGSILNSYLPAPLIIDYKIQKDLFNIIDDIAEKNKLSKIMFAIDPLDCEAKYNFLQKYGYLDTSILSYIIDLTGDADLLQSCRRGHRSDIKRILQDNDFEVFFMDKNNADYLIHEDYRRLHYLCSGKETRSKQSFDCQFVSLKEGRAVLLGLKYKGESIAYTYFEFYGGNAIYYSAADDPKFNKLPLYHVLMYEAMVYLRDKGVKYLDVGQPSSPSAQFYYYPDQKQRNIALFKRGFPGSFVSSYRGIKYFDEDVLKTDIKQFQKLYINIELNNK